ncbi:MAG: DUF4382 domain-containing protein [Nitrospiraceae bacterium]|nr:DUF4382 domain-containing protein [Nitrospiraceae bacterium]MDA8089674.1 DUF4382 domain-containing protein [Nitrospiraceae bacterium]
MKPGKSRVIDLMSLIIGAGLLLASCGGGGGSSPAAGAANPSGGSSSGASQTAAVGLFMTDDASGFGQVSAIINSVTLLNSGSGQSCTVLSSPVHIDLANLSDVMELVKTSNCPAGSFDTVRIAFSNAAGLTDSGGTSSTCAFTSFSSGQPSPDTMSCSGNNCTMDLNTQANILASQNNRVGVDFDLKDFTVTGFGTRVCSVTVRVNPLSGPQMDAMGFHPGITGMIAGATGSTVTINTGARSFIINASSMGQSDFQGFMQTAQTKGFPAIADCTNFDFNAGTCQAGKVLAVATGMVSNLDTSNHTFVLTLNDGTHLDVGFPNANVKGMPEDGQLAVVDLMDMNTSSGTPSDASQIDNVPSGMGSKGLPGFNSPMASGGSGSSGSGGSSMPSSGGTGLPGGGSSGPSSGGSGSSGSGRM